MRERVQHPQCKLPVNTTGTSGRYSQHHIQNRAPQSTPESHPTSEFLADISPVVYLPPPQIPRHLQDRVGRALGTPAPQNQATPGPTLRPLHLDVAEPHRNDRPTGAPVRNDRISLVRNADPAGTTTHNNQPTPETPAPQQRSRAGDISVGGERPVRRDDRLTLPSQIARAREAAVARDTGPLPLSRSHRQNRARGCRNAMPAFDAAVAGFEETLDFDVSD